MAKRAVLRSTFHQLLTSNSQKLARNPASRAFPAKLGYGMFGDFATKIVIE